MGRRLGRAGARFVVPPPFDASSTGDCILRTADDSEFKVHQAILGVASPVFADMVKTSQATNTSGNALILRLSEDPRSLMAMLALVYPLSPPVFDNVDDMHAVVRACEKYSIKTGRLEPSLKIQEFVAKPSNTPEVNLSLYSLAWKLKLKKQAKFASRYLHGVDLNDPRIVTMLIRESGSVNALTELWDLRLKRERELNGIVDKINLRNCLCLDCGSDFAERRVLHLHLR